MSFMSRLTLFTFSAFLTFCLTIPSLHSLRNRAFTPSPAAAPPTPQAEIQAFNKQFIAAHLRMDMPAILSFWADDGISLLPETPPIEGKPAIRKFVEDAIAQMPGYRVTLMEIEFRNIQVSGDWASEWGLEHQVAEGPADKPKFDGHGKILLILHKDSSGTWKVQQEMWNSAPKP